ncbi:MAG: phage terminase large subunit [Burkholderiaceae bacterium]
MNDPQALLTALLQEQESREQTYLEALRENSANSLSCFVEFLTPDEPPADHHEFMCDYLEAIERREVPRAAFSMPPGHAKTKFCSKYFPAWYLGRNSRHRYLQGGHSQAFCENEFGKSVRDIIADNRFRDVFPDVSLNPRSTAAGNWKLGNQKGGYVTKGVGQKLAGYRGHCGGVDDPFGSREDAESAIIREKVRTWFFADYRTRFLPNSPIFIVATRWHEDDLIGHVEQLNKEGKGLPWEIINLNGLIEDEYEAAVDPMGRDVGEPLWAEYYTAPILMELKNTLSARDWWSLYKGRPRPEEGNVVKLNWLRRYDRLPAWKPTPGEQQQVRRITVSVDTANKANERAAYSVATVWMEGVDGFHYCADVRRDKVEFNELIGFIEDTARMWGAHAILVEDKGNGTSYIQQRQGKAPCPIITIKPEAGGSKEFRFDAVLPMFEAGLVLFPKAAPWMGEYESELLQFPNGTYKDQVDSTSQYLNWVRKAQGYGARKMGKNGKQGPKRRRR